MGARLRLKASVDVTERTSDPDVQKIFRAMQKYGLIVADNGSDMYITGTYDTRWNNGILNPAFAALTASDFEVVQLSYSPASAPETALASLSITPAAMTGGQSGTGTVKLTDPAPAGGITVSLSSAIPALDVPVSVTVGAGATTATFAVTALPVEATASGNISAAYAGVTRTAIVTVTKSNVALSSVTVQPRTITGGDSVIGTVNLNGPAPAGGAVVRLASKRPGKAVVPPNVTVPAGSASAQFEIATAVVKSKIAVTISASYGPVTKKTTLTVQKRKPAPKTGAKSEISR
jgi:hypothetical protein